MTLEFYAEFQKLPEKIKFHKIEVNFLFLDSIQPISRETHFNNNNFNSHYFQ